MSQAGWVIGDGSDQNKYFCGVGTKRDGLPGLSITILVKF